REVAYVIAEEGLMLNTLFDPTKNTAGRLWGVNWVWTAGMFVVHSLMSVFVPILLAEAIYYEKADEPWVKPRTLFVLLALFLANVFGLGRLIAPSNRPDALHYLMEAAIIGACLWLAKYSPGPRPATAETRTGHSPLWLYVASLIGMTATTVTGFAAPALAVPAIAKVAVMMTVYAAFLGLLHHGRAFDRGLDPLSKFAVASGMISFWILVSPLTAFGKGNVGPVAFAVLVAAILASTYKRLKEGLAVQPDNRDGV
ncbi:MAG TPA: hypothetical protein VMQ67_13355, partial [Candidatus Saccharimonadales bacterium]|nr:hypothetical protein [Candidatus Saccharimonadales bacterium]